MLQTNRAFIIKVSPYLESDCIIRFLSQSQGMKSGLLPGVYSQVKKAQRLRSSLQLTSHVEISFIERKSLHRITELHLLSPPSKLSPLAFVFICYIHEIILYLLPDNQGEGVYSLYEKFIHCVNALDNQDLDSKLHRLSLEILLRNFELDFLELSGLGVSFETDAETGDLIHAQQGYNLIPQLGFIKAVDSHVKTITGEHLYLINRRDFTLPEVVESARFVCRLLLAHFLDGKTLKSRQLLKDMHF